MSKDNDLRNLLEQLEVFTIELKHLDEYYKNQELDINDKLNDYDDKINSLKDIMNGFNELIDKNREYLLLEIESSLDKHKMIQIQNENKYNELINILKNGNDEKFLLFGEEIGKLKQIIKEKDELIKNKDMEYNNKINSLVEKDNEISDLSLKNSELSNILVEKDNEITSLNDKVNEVITLKDSEIDKLYNDKKVMGGIIEENENIIKSINDDFSKFKEDCAGKKDQYDILITENEIIKLSIVEKNNQIDALKEEIEILNSIINEKDETLDLIMESD